MFFTPLGVCLGMALATRTLLKFMKQFTPKISAPDSMVSGSMESGDNQEFED
jgi:hypothetical protein